MKENWETVTFSEVIDINDYPSLEKGQVHTYVGMKNLDRNVRKIQDTKQKEYRYSAPRFENGDTLMARITPCLENGKTAFVDILDEVEAAFGSTEFLVMSATEETTPKFVYYTCRRPKVRKFAIKRMTGTSGRQRVPKDVFDNLEIELPPLSQQKKIADILGSLDDKIETNNRINQLLEEIAQAIFKSWFVDFEPYEEFKDSELGEIPEEFEVVPFQDIAEIEMGSSPKSEYYNEDGEGLPFFQGSKNFGMRYPKIERWCSEPKKIGEEDDVIMSVRAPVGDLNRLMEKSCVGRGVAAFRMRSTTNEFLFYLLDAYQDKWDKYASGTTYESVNSDDVANFPVIKPPEDKIREFNDLVRPMEQIIKQNTRERDKLSNARDTLLPKLMSGEIRVSDDGVE